MTRQTTLRTQLALRFPLLSFLISAILGAILNFYFRTQIRLQLRQHLQDVVELTAGRVSGDEHARIQPGNDQDSASYRNVFSSVQPVRMTGSEIAAVYTMRTNEEGQIEFVIDTSEKDAAEMGEVYSDPGPLLSASFSTLREPIVEEDFYVDLEKTSWIQTLEAALPYS